MASADLIAIDKLPTDEPYYTIAELSKVSGAAITTFQRAIQKHDTPILRLDGRGTMAIRHSDLLLLGPVGRRAKDALELQQARSTVGHVEFDDLAALTSRLVATWPRLTEDRRRELGALLAVA